MKKQTSKVKIRCFVRSFRWLIKYRCWCSGGNYFSIYKRVSPVGEPCTNADFLQKGTEQVAAGYVMYGSSTMLFYTTGAGVNGFTLDPSIGEFCLSHPDVKTPNSEKPILVIKVITTHLKMA